MEIRTNDQIYEKKNYQRVENNENRVLDQHLIFSIII